MKGSEIESYVEAGEIAKKIKSFVCEMVRPGMKLIDIAEKIDAKILELGGVAAFPVNLGLNEIAAHYTPSTGDETVAEGLLKIDIGVAVDGFIADTAISLDLTEDKRFADMVELNRKILDVASRAVKPGMKVLDVGDAVAGVMDEGSGGFAVIKSLSGHGLGKNMIHTAPTISNYRNNNETVLDNVAFAVEPFVTSGVGDIFEGKPGGIYSLKKERAVRDREARKVLEFVLENYGTRPFCARWLEDAGFSRLKFILSTLVKQGVFYEYPVLIEKSRSPVSQFENTFVVAEGKVICTTG